MASIPDAVPEHALDHDEILHRGGAKCGDEDFAGHLGRPAGQWVAVGHRADPVTIRRGAGHCAAAL